MIRTKLALREVADELGRSVTFMALVDEHLGASMHVNLSLLDGDRNPFFAESGRPEDAPSPPALDRRPAGDDARRRCPCSARP